MTKESIKLKNGKVAIISLLPTKDKYFVTALDTQNNIVGKCIFEIIEREVKFLENTKLKKFEGKFLIKDTNLLNNTATSQIVDEAYIYKNNLSKNSKVKICQLDLIEITDENYFKVGLGSLMFKRMEEFVKSQNCQEIVGWFYPNGSFWHGASDFYTKNGFTFEKEENKIVLRKSNLSKEK